MTIRDIDEKLKARLRVQAARHGRSLEDEARDILRTALSAEPARTGGLVEAIRARATAGRSVRPPMNSQRSARPDALPAGPYRISMRR